MSLRRAENKKFLFGRKCERPMTDRQEHFFLKREKKIKRGGCTT